MKYYITISLLLLISIFTIFHLWKPSAKQILKNTSIDIQNNTIHYESISYEASWSDLIEYKGDARVVHRAYHKNCPFITHEIILTTGEFSDVDIVDIAPIRNGSTRWTAKKKPTGTFLVFHCIPQNLQILDIIENLEEGVSVTVKGRTEKYNQITADNNTYVRLNHVNHKFFLVNEIIAY
jgi:hypothetical protein